MHTPYPVECRLAIRHSARWLLHLRQFYPVARGPLSQELPDMVALFEDTAHMKLNTGNDMDTE
jgi:hypothetical protein